MMEKKKEKKKMVVMRARDAVSDVESILGPAHGGGPSRLYLA